MDKEIKNKKEYLLPKTLVDEHIGFDFEISNPKTDGMISFSSVILVPLAFALIFFGFIQAGYDWKEELTLAQLFITVISGSIGFFITYHRKARFFWSDGYGSLYIYVLLPVLVSILSSIIASMFLKSDSNNSTIVSFISLSGGIIANLAIISIAYKFDENLFARIFRTFKENIKYILIVGFVGLIILFTISTVLATWVLNWVTNNNTIGDNQNGLTGLLSDSRMSIVIPYAILLFIFTIVVAPLAEEIATRHSLFINAGNKWFGLIFTTSYFGFMHISSTFDFSNLAPYLTAGLILGAIFIFVRGNVTYTWVVHVLYNLIAFILAFFPEGIKF